MALGSKGFWVVTVGAAVLVNVIDYGWGGKADVGLGGTEFYAAVTVDLGIGIASAGAGALAAHGAFAIAMLLAPEFAVPALIIGYVFGPIVFAGASHHFGWRESSVRGVTRLYDELTTSRTRTDYVGSPLLY